MWKPLVLAAALLAACAPVPEQRVERGAAPSVRLDLGTMKSFPSAVVVPVTRSNQAMAQDFLDLMFALETGRTLAVMSRFEGPITVGTNGRLPPTLIRDLESVLKRLRSEAGLNIQRVPGRARITIEALPASYLARNSAQAACFVAPNVSSWSEYQTRRTNGDWSTLTERTRMAIFVPADAAPQELRDCLHEELAQSLGPVNDLYRLADSTFNDDNFQSVLTGFDMLMLRVAYDPELRSGMSASEVAARLPAIFARLNPNGGAVGQLSVGSVQRTGWDDAIASALTVRGGEAGRRAAATRALQQAGGDPQKQALAYFALGRSLIGTDNYAAREAMAKAYDIWSGSPVTAIYAASASLPLAAHALATGQTELALSLADRGAVAAADGQNAALYAQFLMVKAEAIAIRGLSAEAERLRSTAYAYAIYGFGSDSAIRQRADSISRLAARAAQ